MYKDTNIIEAEACTNT